MKPITQKPREDLLLWLPALFAYGVAFYFSFEANFLTKFFAFFVLFLTSISLFFLNRTSRFSLAFAACAIFLFGCFYANFYQKIFLNQTKITGKIYVDAVGKIEAIKEFSNPVNGLRGLSLVIAYPKMYKSEFAEKKKVKIQKRAKKKEKKPRKKYKSKKEKILESGLSSEEYEQKAALEKEQKRQERLEKKQQKFLEKQQKISQKIEADFVNLDGYQELDREFLDRSKNYQQVAWIKGKKREIFPNPPQKISVNLIKNFQDLEVNDLVAMRLMLHPPNQKEFLDDFDFNLDAKSKKIGAYGFVLGDAKILQKARISSLDEWFLGLREKIRARILTVVEGDDAAIILAFLIGDQSQISKELMQKIRGSGLAHLLSISGFHLALAATIFFVATRFILSRSEYLALYFDLKKIATIAAIFAAYFYLKIAASPLPAQRSFLMIFLALVSLFFDEKINAKRAVMAVIFFLLLFNPFVIFNISFQLSFVAVLVLTWYRDEFFKNQNNFFGKFFNYFWQIILISILVQIATLPLLMHSFQNVALLGFIANALAIPLVSFFVMPLGFLSLFLMPLGLEKYVLLAVAKGIFLVKKITVFVFDLNYSNLTSPQLPSIGLAIAVFGILLICLLRSRWRFVGIAVFLSAFLTIFTPKPEILFEKNQKFFALFEEESGLVFSKNLKPSKRRELWMKRMGEEEFKYLKICDEKKCVIEKNQKILVLLQRNKISEICKNDFDAIVNLSSRYKIPDCVGEDKIKIDNLDFYQKGGHFLYFLDDKIVVKTTL